MAPSVHLPHPTSQPSYYGERVYGNIDWADRSVVIGWIKYIDSDTPLLIDIYINGSILLSDVLADLVRDDLVVAGFGSGNFGFNLFIDSITTAPALNVTITISGSTEILISKTFLIAATYERMNSPHPAHDDSTDTIKSAFKIKIEECLPTYIRGWAINLTTLEQIFALRILIDNVEFTHCVNDRRRDDLKRKGISHGHGGFKVALPLDMLPVGTYTISVVTPDNTTVSMPLTTVHTTTNRPVFGGYATGFSKDITVVVPIFNAIDDLRTCVQLLDKYTSRYVKILLIDDASTDPDVRAFLDTVDIRRFTVLLNPVNLGFTKSVNIGISYAADDDVILLNSDARVTPRWVEGLRNAAYSRARVGTVTAVSDRAGPFSAPSLTNNELPNSSSEAHFARAFRRHSLALYPTVPTGNGFCMYIRRDCIAEVGLFDDAAFPRGYGEENDFCMRAMGQGWFNIVDDRTYVFHERSKSFGSSRATLIAQGRRIIDRRYPAYTHLVRTAFNHPSFEIIRYRARLARSACDIASSKDRILYVISTKTGGTPQTNADLIRALGDRYDCWLLHCDSQHIELHHFIVNAFTLVTRWELNERVNPLTHISSEYDEIINNLLLSLDIDLLHIRHIAWHSINLISIARLLGVPIVYSLHDYYTLSPTVKLIDDRGVFQGAVFDASPSIYRQSLWGHGSQPTPSGAWLHQWQAQMAASLAECDAYITTSASARDIICSVMCDINRDNFHVIPHGRDFPSMTQLARQPLADEPIRILVPGNIDAAKGLELIYDLAIHDTQGLIQFHILGDVNMTGKSDHPRIIRHGRYKRDDFSVRAAEIAPHMGAILSIWNETYCHTLTELWSVGLPVVTLDFPTVAERVRSCGGGHVIRERSTSDIFNSILSFVHNSARYDKAAAAVREWQLHDGSTNSIRRMADQYAGIYETLIL